MTQKTKKDNSGRNIRGPVQKNATDVAIAGAEEVHTYAIAISGDTTTTFVPFPVTEATGETVELARAIYRCSGGAPTLKVQKNAVDVTGFTGMACSSTQATTDPTNVGVTDKDEISVVCSAGAWTGWLYIGLVFTRAKVT